MKLYYLSTYNTKALKTDVADGCNGGDAIIA